MTKPISVRIAKRIKLFEPALVRYQHAVERIHLLDLSCTGALAHGANPPTVGTIYVSNARRSPSPLGPLGSVVLNMEWHF